MKKFYYMVRMVFMEKMAYMKALLFDAAAALASIFVYYCLWRVVFKDRNEMQGFTMVEITTYIILSRTLAMQFSEGINREFALWIYEGSIGTEMLRPVRLFTNLFSRRVGEFLFYITFKAVPIMLLAFLLLGGAGPAGGINLLLFLLSVLISIGIMFYVEVLVGMGSFYTLTHYALGYTKTAVLDLLSGSVVPIFLFPGFIQEILTFLPFAGMVSVPINIFLGKYALRESLMYIGIQCFWVIIMFFWAHGCFHKVIKKVVVQGG